VRYHESRPYWSQIAYYTSRSSLIELRFAETIIPKRVDWSLFHSTESLPFLLQG
jgi:hypothetical protein